MKRVSDGDELFELWVLIFRTRDALHRMREAELKKAVGITRPEAGVLSIIQLRDGSATPTEIRGFVFREPNSVSGLLSRMEGDGLVRKVKDQKRKNWLRIEMTEKGEEIYKYVEKRLTIHDTMGSLSGNERRQLRSISEKLARKALDLLGTDIKVPWPCD